MNDYVYDDMSLSKIPGHNIFIRTDFEGKTLTEYMTQKARTVLNLPIKSVDGRHLCDYRPMYGQLFEPWLVNYSHWSVFNGGLGLIGWLVSVD